MHWPDFERSIGFSPDPAGCKQRHRILIVDDAPVNIHLLAEILRPEHEVFFATTGKQALEIAAMQQVDLILLDVMMPDVDGYEVCRQIKRDPSVQEIPVIFVTAKSEVEDEVTGFGVGAVDYILKPISPPIVQARVRTHLELKSYRDYLRSLSNFDGITGIPNRRYFDEMLRREYQQARRSGEPISLLMIDIDYFKQYNDRYGHLAGDDCLKLVAQTLTRTLVRPTDFVARYGGEEFSVICPQTDSESSCFVARKILEAVSTLAIPHERSETASHVTISVGAVTLLAKGSSFKLEIPDLIRQADALLYRAKRSGRNRFFHQSVEPSSA